MLTRAQADAFKHEAFLLASQIGLNPAARAIGIKPDRIRKWASRYKWNLSTIREHPSGFNGNAAMSPDVTRPIKVLANVLAIEGDRTRSAMARTARRAFEHADSIKDAELHELPRSVALEKHAKVAAIAHNWTNQQVSVGVAVSVPLPSEDERREMRSIDSKLDAIAAKLKQ